ncbi:MAG TPA: serine/threonine-protein kinase [Polyangiaceae bacterium]|nr:serine/threonine-protein kinase [Polyangiaceae bacterium]
MLAHSDHLGGKSAPPTAHADVFAGTPYRVVRRLGQGGMAEVFLVVHEELGRHLVAKLLHRRLAGDAQLLDRVRVEAHSLARLEQPNIVQVTDFRVTRDGTPFLVMEYLLGRTLREELRARGRLSLLDSLDFVHQALSGLVAVHALGIVHRDIKPDNLFLSEEVDGTITLKVLDFGIARVIPGVSPQGPQPLAVPTQTGTVMGTPRYLSPEAALGKRVDVRADLYSLSLVFYEMVAGCGPFEHLKHDFSSAHSLEDPVPPSRHAKRPLPAELDAAILRGLAKNPDDRYQTAAEFQLEVERLWRLFNGNSQALQTTVFALEERSSIRTTGELRRQVAPSSRSAAVSRSNPESSQASSKAVEGPGTRGSEPASKPDRASESAERRVLFRGIRPALVVASFFLALLTILAVTSAIVVLLGGIAP